MSLNHPNIQSLFLKILSSNLDCGPSSFLKAIIFFSGWLKITNISQLLRPLLVSADPQQKFCLIFQSQIEQIIGSLNSSMKDFFRQFFSTSIVFQTSQVKNNVASDRAKVRARRSPMSLATSAL